MSNGKPRELHIQQSIDVITVPATSEEESIQTAEDIAGEKNTLCELYACEYYRVFKMSLDGNAEFEQSYSFLNMTVIEGEGTVNGQQVKKGDHFILPCGFGTVQMQGTMELIASTAEDLIS